LDQSEHGGQDKQRSERAAASPPITGAPQGCVCCPVSPSPDAIESCRRSWRNWSSGWGEVGWPPVIAASTAVPPDVDVLGKRHSRIAFAIATPIAMIAPMKD